MWRPELTAVTVILDAAPEGFETAAPVDPRALGALLTDQAGIDGRHVIVADAVGEHRLWLRDPTPGRPLAAIIPLDKDFITRIASLLPMLEYQPREFSLPTPDGGSVRWNLTGQPSPYGGGLRALFVSDLAVLDIITANAANGWTRPIYFSSTVAESSELGLQPFMQNEGLARRVMPFETNAGPDGRVGVGTGIRYRRGCPAFSGTCAPDPEGCADTSGSVRKRTEDVWGTRDG